MRVSHLLKCCTEGGGFLLVGEEASDFGFGCQSDDVTKHRAVGRSIGYEGRSYEGVKMGGNMVK